MHKIIKIEKRNCWSCGENKITVKWCGLCHTCYTRFRKYTQNPTRIKRYKYNPSRQKTKYDWIVDLIGRYGNEIIDDLKKLRKNPFITLEQVGIKYGVTREYIRQIYKRYFGEGYGNSCKRIEKDISCSSDPRNKIYLVKKNGSNVRKGTEIEYLFTQKCLELGFNINASCKTDSDIIINGYKVEIKSCFSPQPTSGKYKRRYYRYPVSKSEVAANDFFAFYRPDLNEFVIIKNNYKGTNEHKAFYMPEHKTNYKCSKNNLWSDIGRYDRLIKK